MRRLSLDYPIGITQRINNRQIYLRSLSVGSDTDFVYYQQNQ